MTVQCTVNFIICYDNWYIVLLTTGNLIKKKHSRGHFGSMEVQWNPLNVIPDTRIIRLM